MLDRIVIGTANWGREYNGHCVNEKEQALIMEYMKEVGIEWLDVADAYGTRLVGKGEFNRILKTKIGNIDPLLDIIIAHAKEDYYCGCNGISIYDAYDIPEDLGRKNYIELPYGIVNADNDGIVVLLSLFGHILIARSIFCKGKALKYFSSRECLDFVLMDPRIDKVIIGVDSVDQLKENVAHLVKMETFTHNEEVDTRKF